MDRNAPKTGTGPHDIAGDVSGRPALVMANSFQLLVLRQFHRPSAPPAFAFIDQFLFRRPDRPSRHGTAFELTFVPEIVAWLIGEAGAPSFRDAAGRPCRNPDWPVLGWRTEDRLWPEEIRTVEWYAEAVFPDATLWVTFLNRWRERLERLTDKAAAS